MMIAIEVDLKLLLNPTAVSLLSRLKDFLTSHDIRAYVVGGFLRDLIMERDNADIDIALEADVLSVAPQLADYLGGKSIPMDETIGVVRLVLPVDEEQQWQIDLSTIDGDIHQDLGRRDFTVDAMAISLDSIIKDADTAAIIDSFNGMEDIRHKTIRATSNSIFKADAARLLRAVRLAAELDFNIEKQTEELMRQDCHMVAGIAGERVREELLQLLALQESGSLILYMEELGLTGALMPELTLTKGVEQPREHQWDVFNHSVKVVDAVDFVLHRGSWRFTNEGVLGCIPWSAELADYFKQEVSHGSSRWLLLKLAALLHDIAKPQTKMINTKGRMCFHGHPRQGAPIAAAILERLRFSSREIKLVASIVRHHLRPVQLSQGDNMPTLRAIYRYYRDSGDAATDSLFFSLADHLATRGSALDMDHWWHHTAIVEHIMAQHAVQEKSIKTPRLVDGNDLMQSFNLKPGPQVGRLLAAVNEARACHEITTREEALAYADSLLSEERGGI
jgi:poly(A) polymerase